MIFPATTAFFAGLFALLYAGLAGWVVAGRLSGDVLHGTGDAGLEKRIRSHGNFSEYVPFALLLIALLEARGTTAHWLVETLLIVLLVARLLHPVGMLAPKNSPRQFACRGGGLIATLVVMLVSAGLLLI